MPCIVDFLLGTIVAFLMFGATMNLVVPLNVVVIHYTLFTKPISVHPLLRFVIHGLRGDG